MMIGLYEAFLYNLNENNEGKIIILIITFIKIKILL
jgi:hypothetical protein